MGVLAVCAALLVAGSRAGFAQEPSPVEPVGGRPQADAPGTPLTESSVTLRVGQDYFTVRIVGNCAQDTRYVVLHGSETTAPEAVRRHLEGRSGCLLQLVNPGERLVSFRLGGRRYLFDPNRVFSRRGVEQSLALWNRRLKRLSRRNRARVYDEVEQFGLSLARLIAEPLVSGRRIVAVHNNGTEPKAQFSFETFVDGNGYFRGVQAMYYRRNHSPYNLFLVGNPRDFEELSRRDVNVVLEDGKQAADDGSLSVFCGRAGIAYANVESRLGELETQVRMLDTLRELWDSPPSTGADAPASRP